MFESAYLSSTYNNVIGALDNAKDNCKNNAKSMLNDPIYVLVEGVDDTKKFIKMPLETKIELAKNIFEMPIRNIFNASDIHSKYLFDTPYTEFDRVPRFPICMDTYDRGVSTDSMMDLRAPPSPSISSMRAKAKLQEAKDFRKTMEHMLEMDLSDDVCICDNTYQNQYLSILEELHGNIGKERLDSVDLEDNSDDEILSDLVEDPSNEDDCNSLTYDEQLQLLHLMDACTTEDPTIDEDISGLTYEELQMLQLMDDSVSEEPTNEDDRNYLTYEEELQLQHIMDDNGKIVWDSYVNEEELDSVVETNDESLHSVCGEENEEELESEIGANDELFQSVCEGENDEELESVNECNEDSILGICEVENEEELDSVIETNEETIQSINEEELKNVDESLLMDADLNQYNVGDDEIIV